MRSLLELGEDLLFLIALHFEQKQQVLATLTQVCRTFRLVCRPLLYRHVGNVLREKAELLWRTLAAEPGLKVYVQSCSVHIEFGEVQERELERALEYPNLKEIAFVSSKAMKPNPYRSGMDRIRAQMQRHRNGRNYDQDFQYDFLDTRQFPDTSRLRLEGDFTTTEIMRFMLLPPNVQNIVVQDVDILKAPQLPTGFATRSSRLTSLSLFGDSLFSMQIGTMYEILKACPQLWKLQCQIPVMASWGGPLENPISSVDGCVSPVTFNDILKPVEKTLRHLSLLQVRHDVPYDETHMNLSEFIELTDLHITSCCLILTGPPSEARNRLHALLPPCLEYLELDFPRGSGIFYHHAEGSTFQSQNPDAIPQSRYNWITTFLEHKPTCYPRLAYLGMQDSPGRVGYWRWLQKNWTVAEDVEGLGADMGVKMSIRIRYPNPQSEMESWQERPCKYPPVQIHPWE